MYHILGNLEGKSSGNITKTSQSTCTVSHINFTTNVGLIGKSCEGHGYLSIGVKSIRDQCRPTHSAVFIILAEIKPNLSPVNILKGKISINKTKTSKKTICKWQSRIYVPVSN